MTDLKKLEMNYRAAQAERSQLEAELADNDRLQGVAVAQCDPNRLDELARRKITLPAVIANARRVEIAALKAYEGPWLASLKLVAQEAQGELDAANRASRALLDQHHAERVEADKRVGQAQNAVRAADAAFAAAEKEALAVKEARL